MDSNSKQSCDVCMQHEVFGYVGSNDVTVMSHLCHVTRNDET